MRMPKKEKGATVDMKPQTALKIDYSPFEKYTRAGVETIKNEWVIAYRRIAESDPAKREQCAFLTDRIERAAALFISRYVEPVGSDAISHDDYYYEWLEEVKQEQNDTLDGDFPLGNEKDMKLASSCFSVRELAMLQMGCEDEIDAVRYAEYIRRRKVEKGKKRK